PTPAAFLDLQGSPLKANTNVRTLQATLVEEPTRLVSGSTLSEASRSCRASRRLYGSGDGGMGYLSTAAPGRPVVSCRRIARALAKPSRQRMSLRLDTVPRGPDTQVRVGARSHESRRRHGCAGRDARHEGRRVRVPARPPART